ncbi:MAG: hypothetical protein FWE18_00085 [Alphaproteobacteria bacterium]|nr:hypothetical protein [Alphaproteobacteria bacterium]
MPLISKKKFKKLNNKKKREFVAELLLNGYTRRRVKEELGASNSLVDAVAKELKDKDIGEFTKKTNKVMLAKNQQIAEVVETELEKAKIILSEEDMRKDFTGMLHLELQVKIATLNKLLLDINEDKIKLDHNMLLKEIMKMGH